MQLWKERHECYQCKRPMIIGITSCGSPHQSIHAVVCESCATEEDLAVPTAEEAAMEAYGDFSLEDYIIEWTPEQKEAHDRAIEEFLKKEKEQAQPCG